MKSYLKKKNWICFLAFLLCVQSFCISAFATHTTLQHSIGDFETEKKMDQLLILIQKRLVIMHEVARTKWNQNLPIEDKTREQQIISDLIEQTRKFGLEEAWVTQFFQSQFDAAKEIQKSDFSVWKQQGVEKFNGVLSLKDDLRVYINQINQEMIELIGQIFSKDKKFPHSKFVLNQPISNRESDHIDNHIWQLAVSPLKS
jgi:chorismate mutase-like protein